MIERITLRLADGIDSGQVFGSYRTDDFILDACDWGTARVNATAMILGNDSKETIVHHAWEPRQVVISGYILGTTEADVERKKTAAAYRYTGGEVFDLLYNGFRLQFYLTSDIDFGQTYSEDNDKWCSFTLSGQCEDSRFFNENVTSKLLNATVGMFRFPLQVTAEEPVIMGEIIGDDVLAYHYSGTVSTGMILRTITIYGIGTSITFTCNYQSMTISLPGTLLTAALEIDTRTGFRKVLARRDNDTFDYTSRVSGDWLRLEPGTNIIRCSNKDAIFSVTLNTEPQYEVETL